MLDTSRVLDKLEREATLSYKKDGAANGLKKTGPAGAKGRRRCSRRLGTQRGGSLRERGGRLTHF